eukprot:TRINITY_DN22612_c0_g1_i1.p1 TRINITY_DN22612_c0_g1~~TRINITY_DN22612_c0_g1_i1.p1  ORF type:complete len:212 (+),score=43.57 TRINITY_DN22612_c0_g1_i1:76-636(+)
MQPLVVAVGTTSQAKLAAVASAFSLAFPGRYVDVRPFQSASGVNEQPVGHEETLRGAANRLGAARSSAGESCDYACGLENGIVAIDFPEGALHGADAAPCTRWYDLAWVIVADARSGRRAAAHSTGVEFPAVDVAAAQAQGVASTTAGSRMQERTGCDGKDPHKWLTRGLIVAIDAPHTQCTMFLT